MDRVGHLTKRKQRKVLNLVRRVAVGQLPRLIVEARHQMENPNQKDHVADHRKRNPVSSPRTNVMALGQQHHPEQHQGLLRRLCQQAHGHLQLRLHNLVKHLRNRQLQKERRVQCPLKPNCGNTQSNVFAVKVGDVHCKLLLRLWA